MLDIDACHLRTQGMWRAITERLVSILGERQCITVYETFRNASSLHSLYHRRHLSIHPSIHQLLIQYSIVGHLKYISQQKHNNNYEQRRHSTYGTSVHISPGCSDQQALLHCGWLGKSHKCGRCQTPEQTHQEGPGPSVD